MLDQQRVKLTQSVAALLDEDAATYGALEHQRTLFGATVPELVEVLHGLDTRAAHDYEGACTDVNGGELGGTEVVRYV